MQSYADAIILAEQGAIRWPASPSGSLTISSKRCCACARRGTAARWKTRCASSCGRRPTDAGRDDSRPSPSRPASRARQKAPAAAAQMQAHPSHHRRRHRRLQIARSHPPLAGPRRAGALRSHGGRAAFRDAARRRRALRRTRLHGFVRCAERVRRRPYSPRARHRSHRRRAGDRRPDGENGGRPRRRSCQRRAAGDRQADPDRAGDESRACGPPRRRSAISRSLRADGVRVVGPNSGEMAERGEAGLGRMAEPHGDRRRRRGDAARGRTALRQARSGDVGADARADRSGALHRQSLLRQAGARDRSGGGRRRRRRGAGLRPGRSARSARRHRGEGRDRAADAGGGRKGAARRCRRVRCRGCGLAGRAAERQQDQETGRPAATARACRESRHPGDRRAPQVGPSAARHRICGGDRRRHRQRQSEACQERLRLDSSPTTFRPRPASWAATATRFIWSPLPASNLAAAIEGRCGAQPDRAHRSSAEGGARR